jgi:hypothetical protein
MRGCVIKASGFVDAETAILESSAHVAPQALFVLDNKYPHPELLVSSPKNYLNGTPLAFLVTGVPTFLSRLIPIGAIDTKIGQSRTYVNARVQHLVSGSKKHAD